MASPPSGAASSAKQLVLVAGSANGGREEWVERRVAEAEAGTVAVVGLESDTRSLAWGRKRVCAALGTPGVATVLFHDQASNVAGTRRALAAAARAQAADVSCVLVERAPPGMSSRAAADALQATWSVCWRRAKAALAEARLAAEAAEPLSAAERDRMRLLQAHVYKTAGVPRAGARTAVEPPAITEGYDRIVRATGPQFSCAYHRGGEAATVPFDSSALLLDATVLVSGGRLRTGVANLLHHWYSAGTTASAAAAAAAATPAAAAAAPAARRKRVVVVLLSSLADLQRGWGSASGGSSLTASDAVAQLYALIRALSLPYPVYVYSGTVGGCGAAAAAAPASDGRGVVCAALNAGTSSSGALRSSDASACVLARQTFADLAYLHLVFKLDLSETFVVSGAAAVAGGGAQALRRLCAPTGVGYADLGVLLTALSEGRSETDGALTLLRSATAQTAAVAGPPPPPPPGEPQPAVVAAAFLGAFAGLAPGATAAAQGGAPLGLYYPFLFCSEGAASSVNVAATATHSGVYEHRAAVDEEGSFRSVALVVGSSVERAGYEENLRAAATAAAATAVAAADPSAAVVVEGPLLVSLAGETASALFGAAQVASGRKFFKKNMVFYGGVEADAGAGAAVRCLRVRMSCLAAEGDRRYDVQLTLADPPATRATAVSMRLAHALCSCGKDLCAPAEPAAAAAAEQPPQQSSLCRHAAACALFLADKGIDVPAAVAATLFAPAAAEPQQVLKGFFGKDGGAEGVDDTPADDDLLIEAAASQAAAPAAAVAGCDGATLAAAAAAAANAAAPVEGSRVFGVLEYIRDHTSEPAPPPALPKLGAAPEATAAAAGGGGAEEGVSVCVRPKQGSLPAFMLPKVPKGAKGKRLRVNAAAAAAGVQLPKRPQSSYLHFCASVRPGLMDEHKGANATELAKYQGAMWSALSEEERLPFVTRALQDKERHREEMNAFVRDHPEVLTEQAAAAAAARPAAGKKKGGGGSSSSGTKKKKAAAAAAEPPQPPPPPQNAEDAFYDRFQRQTSWTIGQDGKWVHEWDDSVDAGGGGGAGDDDEDGIAPLPELPLSPPHDSPLTPPPPPQRKRLRTDEAPPGLQLIQDDSGYGVSFADAQPPQPQHAPLPPPPQVEEAPPAAKRRRWAAAEEAPPPPAIELALSEVAPPPPPVDPPAAAAAAAAAVTPQRLSMSRQRSDRSRSTTKGERSSDLGPLLTDLSEGGVGDVEALFFGRGAGERR